MNDKAKKISDFLDSLQGEKEASETIKNILNFVLEVYDADRAYIFESDQELGMGINTYEVCAKGVEPQIDNLQAVPYDAAPRWAEKLYEGESIFINDVTSLKGEYDGEYEILKDQGIQSLIAVPFYKKDVSGYIGIDNPKTMKNEDTVLKIMMHLIINAIMELNLRKNIISSTKNKNVKNPNDIYIKTFGKFQISSYFGNFDEESITSIQCFIFFIYLLLNRNETVSIDKLVSIIWPNQIIYDPYDYVKNVAFRTRKAFANFTGENFIIAKDGSYVLNDKLNIITDYELMDEMYDLSQSTTSMLERINYYHQIIELYDGSMLPRMNGEVWLLSITAKYKKMYLDVVEDFFKILIEKEEYDTILNLSEKVIRINANISFFHYYTVIAYYRSGKKEIAKTYLRQSKDLFTEKEYKTLSKMLKED